MGKTKKNRNAKQGIDTMGVSTSVFTNSCYSIVYKL